MSSMTGGGSALWSPAGTHDAEGTIDSHANNYTLVRLVMASSVIYFHSFR